MGDKHAKLDALLKSNVLKRGNELKTPPPQKEAPRKEATEPPASEASPVPSEAPTSPPPTRAETPTITRQSIRASLSRHQAAMPRLQPDSDTEERRYEPIATPPRYDTASHGPEIEQIVPGEVISYDDSAFYLVRRDYPLEHMQGCISLGKALEVDARHIAFSSFDASLDNFDPRKAVFVDTETSGLAGGAGTVTFLVGAGYFHGDIFRLDQCFMRDYDEEEAMLRYLAELFERFDTVVSYNGKSFDLPLLVTRFIQHRIPPRVGDAMHFDLVHAARRIWKLRLHDCSLGNVEQEVLRLERVGDIPSFMIPQIWFQYLRYKNARPLEGVFYHHRMDILSLVALTGWLSQCLEAPDATGFECIEDRLAILRLQVRQKQYAVAIQTGKNLLPELENPELRKQCLEHIALAAKRSADWENMQEALEEIIEECPESIESRIELAKHLEHRVRDLAQAEEHVLACLELLESGELSNAVSPFHGDRQKAALEKRLARIQRKRPSW